MRGRSVPAGNSRSDPDPHARYHLRATSWLSKNACDRVISIPDLSTNAKALGFSTRTVTLSLPKSTVTMRAMKVASASTVWNEVWSTFCKIVSSDKTLQYHRR